MINQGIGRTVDAMKQSESIDVGDEDGKNKHKSLILYMYVPIVALPRTYEASVNYQMYKVS